MTGQRRPDEMIRILRAEFITKPGGVPGGTCVTFTCGATGWRGAGGTIVRTLVHEAAFQLDSAGNARGAYSVDLQQDRNNATEVAASAYSFIMGQDNRIDAGADHSYALGWANEIGVNAYLCFASGIAHDIDIAGVFGGGQYMIHLFGESHDIDEGNYAFFAGVNINIVTDAFGVYSFGENNDFIENAINNDSPTYTGSYAAIGCDQEGDVWCSLQVGEQNDIFEDSGGNTIYVLQSGFQHWAQHVHDVLQIGTQTCAYDPDIGNYYNGSFLLGDGVNDGFAAVPWQGMNQGRLLSQAGLVGTWNVAWATEWEFPIRQDMVHYFEAIIVGTESGAANSYCWKIEGVIENDGGVTTLLGVPTVTNIYRDVVTKEWQALADNVNNRLIIQFRDTAGPDATACNLQLFLKMVEVGND